MSDLVELEAGILPGVSKPTIDKIRAVGITTVDVLGRQVPKALADEAGIGEDTAERAINKATAFISEGFITGKQLRDKYNARTRLLTGSTALDALLGGGIESETTTEFFGEFKSGKSQVCLTLAVLAQQPIERGGLGGRVAWIDTEDTFRPNRIAQIAQARGLDAEVALDGILHAVAYNTSHQTILINQLYSLCPEKNVKLIIVDSIIGHLRSEYIGRGMLSSRQDQLKKMVHVLMKLSLSTKTTVVYTNQVLSTPDMYGKRINPTGGHVMAHAATTRVFLKKPSNDLVTSRVAMLYDSSYLPPGEAPFEISEMGIDDTKGTKEELKKHAEKMAEVDDPAA